MMLLYFLLFIGGFVLGLMMMALLTQARINQIETDYAAEIRRLTARSSAEES